MFRHMEVAVTTNNNLQIIPYGGAKKLHDNRAATCFWS